MVTRHLWRSIDELIVIPIEKPELRARIQILLRVREQSLELRERAEAAEQAVNMRDEIMEMVSHETAAGLESRQRDQLQAIHRAVHQMVRLTEDLIDVAGLESGYMKVRPSPEPVARLVLGAVQQHGHTAETRDVALTCEIEDGLPLVNVDRARMDQLLGNLITNALKLTPAGGAVVVRAAPAGDRVRFASATPVPASRTMTPPTCSSGSGRGPSATTAPGWAWPSPGASSTNTEAGSE